MRTALLLLVSASFGAAHPAPKESPLPPGAVYFDTDWNCPVYISRFDDTCYRVERAGGILLKKTRFWWCVMPARKSKDDNGWEPLPEAMWFNREAGDIRRQLHRYQTEKRP